MPTKCVICNAKNNEKRFYSFPKDEVRKKLWLKACGINLCLPSYRVCEAHFSEKDFLTRGRLNSIAIPEGNSIQKEPPVSTNTVFESSHQETMSPDTVMYHTSTNSICVTPKKLGSNELPDVSSSKKRKIYNPATIGGLSPSHFDTPRKAKRNLEMVKRKYDQKRTENVNLKRQVKRLQLKVRSFDDLISKMSIV